MPTSRLVMVGNLAYGLLLWKQTRNQVFQDDVRERKEEEGKTYIDGQ